MEEKTLPERLREFAQWIEDGREIQWWSDAAKRWEEKTNGTFNENVPYRAKPVKPHVLNPKVISTYSSVFESGSLYVQITSEVREVLEKEGLL